MMRPDLFARLQKAAEAFDRVLNITDLQTQQLAAALALSIYGPLFAEAAEAITEREIA